MSAASLGLFPGRPAKIFIRVDSCEGGVDAAASTARAISQIVASRPVLRFFGGDAARQAEGSRLLYDGQDLGQQSSDATKLIVASCLTAFLGILSAFATCGGLIYMQQRMRPTFGRTLRNLARRRTSAFPKSISMRVLVATLIHQLHPRIVAANDGPLARILTAGNEELHFLTAELARALIEIACIAQTVKALEWATAVIEAASEVGSAYPVYSVAVAASLTIGDEHVPVRRALALALEGEGAAGSPPLLHVQMATLSRNVGTRIEAVEALASLGAAAEPAVGDLQTALRDRDKDVRRAAAEALGRLGAAAEPAAGDLQTALRDRDKDVRGAAAEALGSLGAAAEPAVGDLQTALRDWDADARRAAAEALGRLGAAAEPAVGDLQRALRDGDKDVRRAAAEALGRLAAVGHLQTALRDRDKDVRRAAAEALGRLGAAAEPAVGDLQRAFRDGDEGVRGAAAVALFTLAAVGHLQTALRDRDKDVRRAAAEALGRLGAAAEPAVGDLQMVLRDGGWRVRRAAAEALGRLGAASEFAVGAMGRLAAVGHLQTALRDRDKDVRRAAAEALGSLGAAAAPAVGDLQRALRDGDEGVRGAAAAALGRLGAAAKPAVGDLLRALRDGDEGVRGAAAEALGRLGAAAEPAIGDLLRALRDGDEGMRGAAAEALGRLGAAAEPAVGDLQMVLRDGGWRVRRAAAEALGSLGAAAEPAVGDLQTALRDWDADARRAAAEALGRLGAAAAVGDLQTALRHWDADVRRAAAEALGRLGAAAEPAVGDLQTALRDRDKDVRRAAAEALGRLGAAAEPAVGDLQRALRDGDEGVRGAAAEALGRLGAAAEPAVGDLQRALRDRGWRVRRAAAGALALLDGSVHALIASDNHGLVHRLGEAALQQACEAFPVEMPCFADFVRSLQGLLAPATCDPFVAEMAWEWRALLVLPSPWTLVSAAVAFIVTSTRPSLAELLAQPHCIVRCHSDIHQGCKLWTWKLPARIRRHHSWDSWKNWRKWWLVTHLARCCSLRSWEALRNWLSAFRERQTFIQVLQAQDVERLQAAAQLYHYATRLEAVQKPDFFDPAVLAVFRHLGISVLPAKSQDGEPSGGLQFVSSDVLRPLLVNVAAMEEAAFQALDVTSYDKSPPVPVLRPGWPLIDAATVSLHIVLLILMAFWPLALLCISEVSAAPFLGRSPMDGLTMSHFNVRFPQLSSVLLRTSPVPRHRVSRDGRGYP
ncbi:ILA [Symbiodinium natans]|uniref:ILA protein n=1 Tax=Symbiodinium natans TaxID=878477 RepID=A0A812PVA2_9DINO|nr:ILA [Symbiodinium natans]